MNANELNGTHVGQRIGYKYMLLTSKRTFEVTGKLSMITHKANGSVRLRLNGNQEHVLDADTMVECSPIK